MRKLEVLALAQTVSWGGKLAKRKMIHKEQIIEFIKELQTEQWQNDVEYFKEWLLRQAYRDSKTKTRQTKAYDLFQRFLNEVESDIAPPAAIKGGDAPRGSEENEVVKS